MSSTHTPAPQCTNGPCHDSTDSYRGRIQKARIVDIARQVGAFAVAALTAASTLNGYRPLARTGYPSMWSWAFGLVVTEFPLQVLVSQLGGLMLTTRRLARPVRTTAWLAAGLS